MEDAPLSRACLSNAPDAAGVDVVHTRMGIDADPRAEPKLDCQEDGILKFSGTSIRLDGSALPCAARRGQGRMFGGRSHPPFRNDRVWTEFERWLFGQLSRPIAGPGL